MYEFFFFFLEEILETAREDELSSKFIPTASLY